MTKIAINGLGRIGKLIMRAFEADGAPGEIVLLNDLGADIAQHALLLEFDTVHGRWDADISHDDEAITVNGKRMAFTFLGCSKDATRSFLEDYRVTDLGNGSCRVEWYMAMEVNGLSRRLMPFTRPAIRLANKIMFRKFRKYTEAYAAGEVSLGAA
mgnify:CR=1 FL=1